MKYLLGMGFCGSVYKRIPTIQLFVGERLIDEYEPTSIDGYEKYDAVFNRDWWASHGNSSIKNIEYKDSITHLPKNFKLYTLDEQVLKTSSTIKLKIKNADTNYTNGFMTKSTLMNMSFIFLLPIKIFEYYLTRQKTANEMFNKVKHIIPSFTNIWDNILDAKFKDSWFKGYPFPFKYFWNDEIIFNSLNHSFGGNGTLKFDIICENNIVMFDYYKDQLIELMQNGYISTTHINTRKGISNGFPFSNEFFVLSHMLNYNK